MTYKLVLIFMYSWLLTPFNCDYVDEIGEYNYSPENEWPEYKKFGQISGVAVDVMDNVYVFHRGDRVWDHLTFSEFNMFTNIAGGPISEDTIVSLNAVSGALLTKTGSHLFYMPHGLTVDHENNIWVTDVALHQVFKFSPLITLKGETNSKLGKPLLSLGIAFKPGCGDNQFCKPTDVAVDKSNNDFFVSDGYCNSRIIKYNQNGQKLFEIGRTTIGNPQNDLYMLNVPHAVTIGEKENVLYVADRENFRVISYNSTNGRSKDVFAAELKRQVFSVALSNIRNASYQGNTYPKVVSTYDTVTRMDLHLFAPSNLRNPHDLAVTRNGLFCFLVELNPCKIWKFKLEMVTNQKGEFTSTSVKAVGKMDSANNEVIKILQSKGDSTLLTIGLVVFFVVISFILFLYHYMKRRGYRRNELRRLILDGDDEDPSTGEIRLN
ncbi:hypothetical protein RUM44_005496 [Polyplax serrata]|uniref:peptidylamidoglycolate lyase n=1 Tax=Polyplax serrata TaxID=468196 RepID=A0ABR1ADJ8_POLSC